MTESEFDAKYPLIKNHLDENALWDGCMFETYGEEVEFVCKANPKTIWTWIDGEGGDLVVAGYHYVNRIGYLISEVEWTDENESMVFDKIDTDITSSTLSIKGDTYELISVDGDVLVDGDVEYNTPMEFDVDDVEYTLTLQQDKGQVFAYVQEIDKPSTMRQIKVTPFF